jgi:hypothetical protein
MTLGALVWSEALDMVKTSEGLEGMESWELEDILDVADMLEAANIPERPDIVDPRTGLHPHETVYCVKPYIFAVADRKWSEERTSGMKECRLKLLT